MKKNTALWLILATVLVLLGGCIFVAAMTKLGWDFTKLSLSNYETNTYTLRADFTAIEVDTDTADIRFLPADSEECTVVIHEKENMKHTVTVENGILAITAVDEREWYDYIFSFGQETLTVYLPESTYDSLSIDSDTGDVEIPESFSFGSLKIELSTGDVTCSASAANSITVIVSTGRITLRNLSARALLLCSTTGRISLANVTCAEDLRIEVSTGDVYLSRVTCKNLVSTGDTGDINLRDVVAAETFSIERSTGDVELERSDAAGITVTTSTGDVEGTLLTEKTFIAQTSTGDVDVPREGNGGRCEISTGTGDIKIKIGP